ncbi:hypothetical protein CONPUDRAFT_78229 [Coniophora puteana RWD-64-598 SS2]|uniref:Uncharacterized protein n=1 Tax=Coniophora puteana (strain RWD-64-598) TaxID=741705 RepID=R7SEV8_CONPW|nr:uncharacterized protein CONPUDRAFT_78229 [Coniophora puteana RWD-64-598 SS2]EIW74272.1 hypothetical protein CONPUDRAFT_78229 [Coniophora puteana RWD-64-598 SS2]
MTTVFVPGINQRIILAVENQLALDNGLLSGFVFMLHDYGKDGGHYWTVCSGALYSWNIVLPPQGCLSMFLISDPLKDIITFLLQGMLAIRVYLLYGKSKLVLFPLLTGFIVTHIANSAVGIVTWIVAFKFDDELQYANIATCQLYYPAEYTWLLPASNSIILGFEVLLSGFVFRYALKHLPTPFWRSPKRSLCTMKSVIVQDNLIYFLIALFALVVNIIEGSPIASPGPCASCWIIAKMTRFIHLTMIGPWMVLSLQRQHDSDVNGTQSETQASAPMRFAATSSVSTEATRETHSWRTPMIQLVIPGFPEICSCGGGKLR